jgi:hypothetical protein
VRVWRERERERERNEQSQSEKVRSVRVTRDYRPFSQMTKTYHSLVLAPCTRTGRSEGVPVLN